MKTLISPRPYVPLTSDGNIIVDGIVASCYASLDHDLAHISMKPMQWSSKIIGWIFGEKYGFPTFIRTTEELGKWIMPYWQLLQYWHQTLFKLFEHYLEMVFLNLNIVNQI